MRHKLLAMAILCGLGASAQTSAVKKTVRMKTLRVSFVSTGEGQQPQRKEESRNMDRFFYDANGNLVQTSKYNYVKGVMTLQKDTIYTYDDAGKLVADSSDKVKTNYYYDARGRLERSASYSYRTAKPQRKDSTVCTYDTADRLTLRTHYNDKSVKRSEDRFNYSAAGLLTSIETHSFQASGNSRKSTQTNYAYNAANQLAEESTVKFSGSKEDMQSRKLYSYDTAGRLETDTVYGKVKADFRITFKHVYHYDGADILPATVEEYSYNPQTETFVETSRMEYVNATHSSARAPRNVRVAKGSKLTDVKFALDKPADAQGLMGYNVIADYAVVDTLFQGEDFILPGQTRGKHQYRIVPVFADSITANCSDAAPYEINITLGAPANPQVVSKEYYAKWSVKIKWDAPENNGATLKGYRWKAQKGSNVGSGSTSAPQQLFGTFDYYAKEATDVSLYAIYEEGESDPVTFTVDLSDTKDQITEHWQNQGFTLKDAAGATTQVGHYYYNSSSVGEELDCQVNYSPSGTPLERRKVAVKPFSTKMLSDITEAYDAETLGWKDNIKIIYGYTPGGTLESKTTYQFDATANEFKKKEVEWYTFVYSISYTIPAYTNRYEFNEAGDSTFVAFIQTSISNNPDGTGYTQTDRVLNSDGPLGNVTGEVETIYAEKERMTSRTVSTIVDGNLTPASRTLKEYSKETNLCTREAEETYEDGTWKLVSERIFTPSKEYHFTRMPKSLHFSKGTLTWAEPERTKDLTGYKVLVNGVEKTTTTTLSCELKDLKVGRYSVCVMPLYSGSDGSLSKALTVRITSPVDGITAIPASEIEQLSDGSVIIPRATRLELYDASGRKLASGVGSQLRIPQSIRGVLLLKAIYADGRTGTIKLAR